MTDLDYPAYGGESPLDQPMPSEAFTTRVFTPAEAASPAEPPAEPAAHAPVSIPAEPLPGNAPAPEQQKRNYAFKVRNLSKDYGGHKVLDDISFDIPAGKIVGLLGPNGCGKTTLIKILAGLIHDYTGMVLVDGKRIGVASKAAVALLPDSTYFPDRFRTIDCINYFADFFADFNKVKAIEFASEFGLDLNQRIKAMSKGMQEKLQLILVMSREADLYILDEPLGGVDPATRETILDTILSNFRDGASLIISTHMIAEVERILDEVVIIRDGVVALSGAADELRERENASIDEIFRRTVK